MEILFYIFVVSLGLVSCQSSKQTRSGTTPAPSGIAGIGIYFKGANTLSIPNDEFTIDSSGKVLFISQQQMATGEWREPKGMAFIEPDDKDTLMLFFQDSNMFKIKNEDVNTLCADGALITLRVHRTDMKQPLTLETSTCAAEYNTLYGETRKKFKKMIYFFQRFRDKYRPMYLDKDKLK
jgi:hypothetical protein